jgi:hypothetical protein
MAVQRLGETSRGFPRAPTELFPSRRGCPWTKPSMAFVYSGDRGKRLVIRAGAKRWTSQVPIPYPFGRGSLSRPPTITGLAMAGLHDVLARVRGGRIAPTEITTLATEILAAEQGIAAASLFAALRDVPSGDVAANVLEVLRELAYRSASWGRLVDKSLSKRGRCPPALRGQLKRLLAEDETRPIAGSETLGDSIAADVFGEFPVERQLDVPVHRGVATYERSRRFFGGSRGRIVLSRDVTDIRGMDHLAGVLTELADCDKVTLDFQSVEHVYVPGLTAIKAWSESNHIEIDCVNASAETAAYLDVVGFSGLRPVRSLARTPDFLTPGIENVGASPAHDIADRLVKLIDHHHALGNETRSGLHVMFAELVENVHRHAGERSPAAFACAQVYPKRNRLTVCIVDTGMGLAESIATGSNAALSQRLNRGESALSLACAPLLTSKPDRHSGYGLYVATELILRNGGTFRMLSGCECMTLYRKHWRRQESFANRLWPNSLLHLTDEVPGAQLP